MKHRLAATLILVAATILAPAPAQAAACTGSTGVTVVVQFPDGRIVVRCAPGDPTSGMDALDKAGFHHSPVPGQGGGTVCRIDGQPGEGEPCWQPPDYWAYFYAQRAGSWTYSAIGAASRDPKPGTVEGWRFRGSSSKPPSIAPPAAPKPSSSPSPTRSASPGGQPTTAKTTAAAGDPSQGANSSPSVDPTATDGPDASSSASPGSSDSPTASPGDELTGAAAVDATDEPFRETSDQGGLSWIWGLTLVVVIGLAGGVAAVRRRRS